MLLGLILLASVIFTTWNAAEVVEIDGMTFGIWMPVMLLLCPLTWNHEITLILLPYLFAAIYFVRYRPTLSWIAIIALALAIGGHVAAYYSTRVRNLHADFGAVIAGYVAISMLIHDWSVQAATE